MSKNPKGKVTTPNNPCIMCDGPETECNMIGCQNEDLKCENWLHYKCDPEVMNDQGADKIEYYYCPPCREKGKTLTWYVNQPAKKKENHECTEEPSTKKDGENNTPNNKNEENDLDYAEEALHSPLLTPYQPQGESKERHEESDHELSKLIDSFPDPVKEDPNYKIKEIVEKIKNVSISKDKEKPGKITKSKNKKMIHRSRDEILKENTKLNRKIEKLTTEKENAEQKNKEMEKAINIELEYRGKMEMLEQELKNKDEKSIEKIIYEAENCKQAQDKKIKELLSKIEEYRKKTAEKQNEIKELKNHNEKCLSEINTLQTACKNETELRTKAESLLLLTEEKVRTHETKLNVCNENHISQINDLNEQLKNLNKTHEKCPLKIEKLNEKLKIKRQNDVNKIDNDLVQPNIIEDNVEMVQIIDSLRSQLEEVKEENHTLTVSNVEAQIELKLRKEIMDELNKSYAKQIEQLSTFHSSHLEEISNTYIQKLLQHQKDADNKIQKMAQQNESKKSENQAIQQLTEQLKIKTQETDKLRNELKQYGEEKYKQIKKATEPPPRKQGIPNKYKNGCFMIAPIHALTSIINTKEINEENSIAKYVSKAKDCIEGNKTEIEAEELMTEIWEFSKAEWPQYKEKEGVCYQECATEYLNRAIKSSHTIQQQVETTYVQVTECVNPECKATIISPKQKTNLNEAYNYKSLEKLELQTLIDEHLIKSEEVCPHCHQNARTRKHIEKAPSYLIISLPRHTEEGEKIETEITHKQQYIRIRENNEEIRYGAIGAIVHRGTQGASGHYIYNRLNVQTREWEQIDDNAIITGEKCAEENNQGIIFILQKLKHPNENYNHKDEKLIVREEWEEEVYEGPPIAPRPGKNSKDLNQPWEKPKEKWQKVTHKRSTNPRREINTTSYIPCRYYKLDKCREGYNCKYFHHTCLDFLNGKCMYNDYCKYRHPEKKPKDTNYNHKKY